MSHVIHLKHSQRVIYPNCGRKSANATVVLLWVGGFSLLCLSGTTGHIVLLQGPHGTQLWRTTRDSSSMFKKNVYFSPILSSVSPRH